MQAMAPLYPARFAYSRKCNLEYSICIFTHLCPYVIIEYIIQLLNFNVITKGCMMSATFGGNTTTTTFTKREDCVVVPVSYS